MGMINKLVVVDDDVYEESKLICVSLRSKSRPRLVQFSSVNVPKWLSTKSLSDRQPHTSFF